MTSDDDPDKLRNIMAQSEKSRFYIIKSYKDDIDKILEDETESAEGKESQFLTKVKEFDDAMLKHLKKVTNWGNPLSVRDRESLKEYIETNYKESLKTKEEYNKNTVMPELEKQKELEQEQKAKDDEAKRIKKTDKENTRRIKVLQTEWKDLLRPKHRELMAIAFNSIELIDKVATYYIPEINRINEKFSDVPQDEDLEELLSEIKTIKEKAEKIKEINSLLEVKTSEYLSKMHYSYLTKLKGGEDGGEMYSAALRTRGLHRDVYVKQLTQISTLKPQYLSWVEKYLTENKGGDDDELVKARKRKVDTTATTPELDELANLKLVKTRLSDLETKCPCAKLGGGKNKRKKNTKNKRKKNTKRKFSTKRKSKKSTKKKKYTKKKKSTKRKNVRNR